MEGLSKSLYKGKEIIYVDYSSFGTNKEKTISLIKGVTSELSMRPPKSVLILVNVTNMSFDTEVGNAFKESRKKAFYEKKTAVIGLNSLQRLMYNFVINMGERDVVRAFESETEAKEWLVSEK
jgi:hypothetical protein